MKICSYAFLALAALGAASARALDDSAWSHRLEFEVPEAGLLQLELPPGVLALAEVDLRDVRLVETGGRELPWRVWGGEAEPATWLAGENLEVTLANGETVVRFSTRETAPIDALELKSAPGNFVKAVDVESSADGQSWESAVQGAPWFSQNGVQESRVRFAPRSAAFWRIRIDDRAGEPRPVIAVQLKRAARGGLPPRRAALKILGREEFARRSVLTLALPHAHAPLAGLHVQTAEPIFQRTVHVETRQIVDEQLLDREIGRGVIHRLALPNRPTAVNLAVPVTAPLPDATVQLVIENGDNAPLPISGVEADLRPVRLVFAAAAPGKVTLLVGASGQTRPRYDLPVEPSNYPAARLLETVDQAVAANPNYRARESLPGVPLEGAAIELGAWRARRVVRLAQPGFQQLELDLAALAHAQPSLSDLRVVRANGKQVPFLVAKAALERAHPFNPALEPDPKRPNVSRWKIVLPQPNLPLSRLTLLSSTALFERPVRIVQRMRDNRGEMRDQTVVETVWQVQPGVFGPARLDLPLGNRPFEQTLYFEVENGDNQPIELTGGEIATPVVRLFFKTENVEPVTLAYANPAAPAPRYDLRLVAGQVLAAPKHVATLDASAAAAVPDPAGSSGLGGYGKYAFWGALALVVVLMLGVVAKLAPKPPET